MMTLNLLNAIKTYIDCFPNHDAVIINKIPNMAGGYYEDKIGRVFHADTSAQGDGCYYFSFNEEDLEWVPESANEDERNDGIMEIDRMSESDLVFLYSKVLAYIER